MTTGRKLDISIIGGGMVGATLALLLADTLPERNVVLLEARPFRPGDLDLPSFDARSTALSPTSVHALKRLNVWQSLAEFMTPIERIRVSDAGFPGLLQLTMADNGDEPLGFVVENRGLGGALADALALRANLSVQAPAMVDRLVPRTGGTDVVLTDGTVLTCELAIVADGADSPLRRQLGIAESEMDYSQFALVTNIAHDKPHAGVAHERFADEGPMALLPLGGPSGRHSALVLTCDEFRREELASWPDEFLLAFVQKGFGYRRGRFTQVATRHFYPLTLRWAREQARSGVVLMGNAAHYLHPLAGQGFNLSMRDCLRLAEILVRAEAGFLGDLALLQAYERAQHSDQWRTIGLSHGFSRLFARRDPVSGMVRSAGLLGLEFSGVLRHRFIDLMAGRVAQQAQPWSSRQ